MPDNTIIEGLVKELGPAQVVTAEDELTFYSTDIYNFRARAGAVVRPRSTQDVQGVVRLANELGAAVLVRGGGASYTDAYLPASEHSILIDTGSMADILEINLEDMFVTVQPGVTWEQLDNALKPAGVRAPFWGPFSGIAATVGGSVSQHTLSHGSAAYGISAESVIAMEVVLGTGEILRTGSASHKAGAAPFYRFTGPDLTGLFTGDAGSFGVKTSITLRLIRRRAALGCESFSFKDFPALCTAMAEVAREGLADENFSLDPVLQQGQIARQDTSAMLKTAWRVFRESSDPISGGLTLSRMAMAGRSFLEDGAYSAHFIVNGVSSAEVRAKLSALRAICMKTGVVIPNTVPTVVASMPFAPMFNMLGPRGERWVPAHGVLPFSQAEKFHRAWQAVMAAERDNLAAHKALVGGMFSTIATNAFLYEVAFYWEDERNAYHNRTLPPDYLNGIAAYAPSPDGRAYIETLKQTFIGLLEDFGAIHFQIGKAYPFLSTRTEEAAAALLRIKRELDPNTIMNPGALEFSAAQNKSGD